MPRGKMKKRLPPPPPPEAEEEPIFSKSEMDDLVYRTIKYGDIFRFRAMIGELDNADVSGSVNRQSSHYVHENTVDFELSTDWRYATKHGTDEELTEQEQEQLDALANKVQEDIDSIVTDICRAIYKNLEAEHDYLTSDEQVDESIRANEYTFDEDGHRDNNSEITFDQLEDSAKERARDWYREGALDYEWWEFIYEDWKTWLENSGFESPEINFSGFWSQGDGASFTCRSFDLTAFCNMLANPDTAKEKRLG